MLSEEQLMYTTTIDVNAGNTEALNDNKEVILTLLSYGANVRTNNNYCLRWSALLERIDIVKILLEAGADIHECDDIVLRTSIEQDHCEVTKVLLEYGANIHANNGAIIKGRNEYSKEMQEVIAPYCAITHHHYLL